ncbi:CLUMA_CG004111, isoform A [Clunio marinus]|uniref:CLUMA_CG004111, isoform A n=1 Tax=Clunio marinus TaxID=568069 RepID=A0A1J1HQV5_9DIPT|nr:CLUMA_CG004111, isoform A [Clunio marinus]
MIMMQSPPRGSFTAYVIGKDFKYFNQVKLKGMNESENAKLSKNVTQVLHTKITQHSYKLLEREIDEINKLKLISCDDDDDGKSFEKKKRIDMPTRLLK